jgi:hypothetical protein
LNRNRNIRNNLTIYLTLTLCLFRTCPCQYNKKDKNKQINNYRFPKYKKVQSTSPSLPRPLWNKSPNTPS